jgi:O-antigen/teichoic acid export membrane protein
VTYPMLAGMPAEAATRQARRLILPAALVTMLGAAPFVLLAGPVIGLLYGDKFHSAVLPAQVLVLGMVLGGAAGVASGYLYGRGRPGLNSWAFALGLAVTVLLDVLLIPRYGVTGAACASTTAYLLTDAALVVVLRRAGRSTADELQGVPTPSEGVAT